MDEMEKNSKRKMVRALLASLKKHAANEVSGNLALPANREPVPSAEEPAMAKGGLDLHLKKGALHEELGVPQDEPIPDKKLGKALNSDNELLRKRAQFAENAKSFKHADGGVVENPEEETEADVEHLAPADDGADEEAMSNMEKETTPYDKEMAEEDVDNNSSAFDAFMSRKKKRS